MMHTSQSDALQYLHKTDWHVTDGQTDAQTGVASLPIPTLCRNAAPVRTMLIWQE